MSTPTTIDLPFPDTENLRLRLAVGACRLIIRPGAGERWVTGTYDDPSNAVPLRITQEGGNVTISQEVNWPQTWGTFKEPPTFDLVLGAGRAYSLALEGGASETDVDLGGLPITRLTIKYGAGKQVIDFSAPNPQKMSDLTVAMGAAGLDISNLANARFAYMSVEGGAAGCNLDFGGDLTQDAMVRITAAVSGIELRVPKSTAVKASAETILGGFDVGDGFMKKEGAFWNEAALQGGSPLLTITASVTMGGIDLRLT
ncbi:MAG: hypothetical protein J5I90_10030 [Caldilineales bacterium]|nr:hypothetical protein [Caldilineales bacterium]